MLVFLLYFLPKDPLCLTHLDSLLLAGKILYPFLSRQLLDYQTYLCTFHPLTKSVFYIFIISLTSCFGNKKFVTTINPLYYCQNDGLDSIFSLFFVVNLSSHKNRTLEISRVPGFIHYSNSIVPGGFPVQSYTTRLTWSTSLTMRVVTRSIRSHGRWAASAVMKSLVVTARNAMA